ncbi:putative serine/threonine-protein phosphatase KNAG_0F00940 [Huiozyma naganishii CBS 8797]|uniref:Calcineurin-like phosphoesterase domain-containing protein n=1 Tax=Huiozyma naganishii (strain ATCC MYA-139 / BCRC 22969 / CBS 8797 / KCTC 17520 / NBRC 10181 / NCYC 3082 / Yp74L-3) TaxID=1071383 RepID=J7RMH8_HUIN7|nr:hypothetical protein KNAG_0F00940 [Kazachstania naganishii CBS 8797]CCK70763.1 hypothetical protein KNAG_0F00940 [Kazachstania naganishii CBS 8797]
MNWGYRMSIAVVALVSVFVVVFYTVLPPGANAVSPLPVIRIISSVQRLTDPREKLLFVGDVHGRYDALLQLIDTQYGGIDAVDEHTKIVLLGDFLMKGPQSKEVADYILSHKDKIACLLGNTEITVLLSAVNPFYRFRMRNPLVFSHNKTVSSAMRDSAHELIFEPKGKHRAMVSELGYPRLSRLAEHCTIAAKFDLTLTGSTLYGVHAGMIPGDFSDDEHALSSVASLVNMKYVNGKNKTQTARKQSSLPHAKRWYKLWEGTRSPVTVLYGHDASRGLNLRKHTKGLDSGCARGGQLSALEYSYNTGDHEYTAQLLQVHC